MKVEVINTGSELLLGHTINTHLATLAEALFPLGLRIQRQTTVPDGNAIRDAVAQSLERSSYIIITGGLGPTSDDLTREIVADLLAAPLEFSDAVWRQIEAFFSRRNRQPTENNRRQAYVPQGAEPLPNPHGTAPGLWFDTKWKGEERTLILLPGPPRELNPMLYDHVIPRLRSRLQLPQPIQAIWSLVGLGESVVAEAVEDFLKNLSGVEYGYCARNGQVDIRLVAKENKPIEKAAAFFSEKFGERVFRSDGKPLELWIVQMARERGLTLALAESCTGGLIAHRLTNVPGASEILRGGWVAYTVEMKLEMLKVPARYIETYGVVSSEVASSMASKAREIADTDWAVATTGYAGPSGGTDRDPVGTCYVAWSNRRGTTEVERLFFPMDRESFKLRVAQCALDGLRMRIG